MPDDVQNGQELVEQKPPEAVSTSNETQEESDDLPEDVSERTRNEFAKLKEHNKQLSERLKAVEDEKNKPTGSVFDSFQLPEIELPKVPNLSNQQVNDVYANLVDKDGYIDQIALTKALREANENAKQAREEAKRAREELDKRTESQQIKAAHKEFPWLDPKNIKKFDKKFYNAVRNEMVSQMIKGEKDLVEAARKVAEWYPLPKEEEELAKKEEQVKVANVTGTTSSRKAPSNNASDLQRRMWRGDRSALLERLSNAGL